MKFSNITILDEREKVKSVHWSNLEVGDQFLFNNNLYMKCAIPVYQYGEIHHMEEYILSIKDGKMISPSDYPGSIQTIPVSTTIIINK